MVLAAGVLATSSASILIRKAQFEQAPSLLIAAWRVSVATSVLTPIVWAKYRPELQRLTGREMGFALLAGLLLGIHFASWITSLEYTSVISSVVLVSMNPLFVALAAPILIRERLSRVTWAGILVATAGAIVVSVGGGAGTAPKQGLPMLGNALSIVGAITVAGYYMIGRRVRARVSVIPYIWLTYGSAAIVLILMVLVAGQPVTGLSGNAYIWMTLVGLIPQLIGHSAYNYALGYLSAAYVSLTILGEPIGSTILAAIFLSEQPALLQIAGGVLILFALFIASREEARVARELQATAA
jgi:drug/metabolite transporter (DMT)-like permease